MSKFLESTDNVRPLIKKLTGREPSAAIARDITACLQQGRLFYEAAADAPLEIRPLQLPSRARQRFASGSRRKRHFLCQLQDC
jgi:hypothetical protein